MRYCGASVKKNDTFQELCANQYSNFSLYTRAAEYNTGGSEVFCDWSEDSVSWITSQNIQEWSGAGWFGQAFSWFLFYETFGRFTLCCCLTCRYRFTGAAGTQMSTSQLDNFACGTNAPGWMVGTHPAVEDGIVYRDVVFKWDTSMYSAQISVLQCAAGFYLYHLPKPPDVS